MLWLHRSVAAIAVAVLIVAPAAATELIMFHRDGCPHCAAWEREIGAIYDKTQISRRAPLRRISLDHGRAAIVLRGPVIYTPTFVLANEDREVARIEGYPGQEFFWGLLERMLDQLPARRTELRPTQRPNMATGGVSMPHKN